MVPVLPLDRVRRLALSAQGLARPRPGEAQGLARPRPGGRTDVRHLRRVRDVNGVVQLDSVQVAARAHEMPFWTRLGHHDRDRRDAWLWDGGENVEVVAHEQSIVPVATWPLLADARDERHRWRGVEELHRDRPGYVEAVYEQVAARGPLTVAELDDGGGERRPGMWGWSPGRVALTWLHQRGRVAIVRDRSLRISYDTVERVLPAEVVAADPPPVEEAHRWLVEAAVRAHGVATAADVVDHWRMRRRRSVRGATRLLEELADDGVVDRVSVPGWPDTAYRHPAVPLPREVDPSARLVSPFDPLVWFRPRLERLWDVEYRIEIYVPRAKRRWGYYVLPVLHRGRPSGRVDLRADRRAGVLEVLAAFAEVHADVPSLARDLATELHSHAAWLGLGAVAVAGRGDLAPALRGAVAAAGPAAAPADAGRAQPAPPPADGDR